MTTTKLTGEDLKRLETAFGEDPKSAIIAKADPDTGGTWLEYADGEHSIYLAESETEEIRLWLNARHDAKGGEDLLAELLDASARLMIPIETGEVQCDVLNGRFWPAVERMRTVLAKLEAQK